MAVALDRRDRIVEAAAKLFAAKGIASTTVRMIGDEVGVLSGSLYHHFASKEEIVDAILAPYFEELLARYDRVLDTGVSPSEQLAELTRESFRSIAEHPEACEIYRNDYKYLAGIARFAHVLDATRRVQRTWIAVIEQGVAAGEMRRDVDPSLFYKFLRDAIWQSARWFKPRGRYDIDEVADACITVLLGGFGVEWRGAGSSTTMRP